jgi:Rrf2 family protein
MRLSTVGRYALRAIVDLALHAGEGPVLCKEIAKRQEISDQYLSQLLLKLKRANLVRSFRGPGGGYTLVRDAAQISARDVLCAVGETLAPVFCVDEGQESTCRRVGGCPTNWLWARLGQAIHEVLDSVTLADLCERSRSSTFHMGGFLGRKVEAKTGES